MGLSEITSYKNIMKITKGFWKNEISNRFWKNWQKLFEKFLGNVVQNYRKILG